MDEEVRLLLEKADFCVLATVSPDGQPEASAMLYGFDEDLTFYFYADSIFRKVFNLRKNPLAAIVVTVKPRTLQVEGKVAFIAGVKETEKAMQVIIKKNPSAAKWLNKSHMVLFKLTPSFVRLRNSKTAEFRQII